MKLKVLIADDHRLMTAGIHRALDDEHEMEVVGEATTGAQVCRSSTRPSPDVVLLDIRMPKMDGLQCLDQIRRATGREGRDALGVLRSRAHPDGALARRVRLHRQDDQPARTSPPRCGQAVDGSVYHALGMPEVKEESEARAVGLTEREVAILKAVARGLSNQAIGQELWVTEQTVKFHLTNIYRKLGVANRTEAARHASRRGLVESPVYEVVA